jgi:hypothetical protein
MKTPTNIGGNNLITFFQNNTEFKKAELYTITLKNGTVLRYTDWQTALTVLGVTFKRGAAEHQARIDRRDHRHGDRDARPADQCAAHRPW